MRRRITLAVGFLLLAGLHSLSRADVPRILPIQAQVKSSTDKPIASPTSFTFSLYAASTGGSALWSETQTLTPANGIVTAILGSVTPLTISFDQSLWVGILVGTDVEMTPRLPLASVPYALSIPDGLVTAAKLASEAGSLSMVSGGAMTSSAGKIGIGTSTPGFPLTLAPALGDKISLWGNSGAHYGFGIQSGQLQIHSDISNSDIVFGYGQSAALTERMRIKGSGNVGIGTNVPASKLTVAGMVQSTTGGFKFPDNTVQTTATPASLPPSGPAGGDLSGTYPDPMIGAGRVATDRIADLAVTDAKIAGMAYGKLTGAPTSLPPTGPAGGDLTGTYPDPVIGTAKVDNTKLASDAGSLSKVSGGTMTSSSGNVGIGTPTPGFLLNFPNAVGDKISLWGDTGNHFGLGVQNNLLQIHTGSNTGDIAFGYGQSSAMTETMRIKGSGSVGIGTSPTHKLTVAGHVRSTAGGFVFPDGSTQTSAGMMSGSIAGGDLTGTYPNPTLKPNVVDNTNLLSDALSLNKVTGGAMTVLSGKIGIGTAAPAAMLSVAGDLQTGSGVIIGRDGPSRGPLDIYGPTGIVDQQQTSSDGTGNNWTYVWQSFTPAATGSLAGVAMYLGTTGSPKPWTGTLRIYSGEGTTGAVLCSQTVSGDGRDVPQIIGLSNPVTVTGAQVYTMHLSVSTAGVTMSPRYKAGNPYAGGRDMMTSDYDLWFKTYMQASLAEPAITVQPMTLNVGIGTTDPKYTLSIVGRMSIDDLPVGDRRAVQWDPDNNLFYRLTSSRRYKENIQPLVDDFDKLLQAEPKTYNYINSPDRQEIGYIAEDIDSLGLKNLVEYDKQGKPDALKYEMMVLYLAQIAKTQQAEIADLKARLSRLERPVTGATP